MFRILRKACFYIYDEDEGYTSEMIEVMVNPSEINYRISADVSSGKMSATGKDSNGLTQYNVPSTVTMDFQLVFDLVDIYDDSVLFKTKLLKTEKLKAMAGGFFKGLLNEGFSGAFSNASDIYNRPQSSDDISVYNPDFTIYPYLRDLHEYQIPVIFTCGRLPAFIGVITTLTPNIEYISAHGNPIRMSVDVSLQELRLDTLSDNKISEVTDAINDQIESMGANR